ncbi:TetR family transcriptional regulator [Microbacterium luticocti]|uniref:TetR family transcriptional regulator n=1 Tax=Microbacterium luticocti TaxID=451764 RepID=UPI0004186A7F|nr:TetR/AcrR family transcriptional regulator C-terminal domain-containing protein [Microbacterium luticocti]
MLNSTIIADAAIALADADGIDAVSMRRVGTALGVSAMAPYRHIADREDLVRRMVARVAETLPPLPDDPADWRETLHHLAMRTWRSFEEHPWLLGVAVSPGRLMDATSARDTELILSRLTAVGLDPQCAGDVFVGTAALVIGMARVMPPGMAAPEIDYAVDRVRGEPAPAADGLTARFRAEPLGGTRGRRIVESAVQIFLDGVEASLTTSRTAGHTRKEQQ